MIKHLFIPHLFASESCFRKLFKSYLVRWKIYPLERKVVSETCKNKRCLVCFNFSETGIFQSFQTKEQYKTNYQLNWNDKCLIYILSCKECGLQYVGSTADKFRMWNNYKENSWKAKKRRGTYAGTCFWAFSPNDHQSFLEDFSITFIDKTDGSDPNRREEYWRRVLKTVTPYGLSKIDWLFYLCKSHC